MRTNRFTLYLAKIGFAFYLLGRVIRHYSRRYYVVYLLMVLLLAGWGIKTYYFPAYQEEIIENLPRETVLIPKGVSFQQIANILEKEGVLTRKRTFLFLGRITGYESRMKAGMFEVPRGLHPWILLRYLTRPHQTQIKVTLPEGITCADMARIFKNRLSVDSTEFMSLVHDSLFIRSLGIAATSLEGYLLPETYYFVWGTTPREIIRRLVRNTLRIFEADSVKQQMAKLGMTRHQILTLASIIEGEAMVDSERVLISSVYHNRLKKGWLLQADPTIQYILPGPPRRLLKKDLEIDSPYNTYKYRGLPPGPINNPGKKSILAALFPARTRYMYFVASGDGGHHFSRTAAEHAYWKARFEEVRRKYRRRK